MPWYNEETGKWEPFGTSPVSDAFWKTMTREEEDAAIFQGVKHNDFKQIEDVIKDFFWGITPPKHPERSVIFRRSKYDPPSSDTNPSKPGSAISHESDKSDSRRDGPDSSNPDATRSGA